MSKKQEEAIDLLLSRISYLRGRWHEHTHDGLYDPADRLTSIEIGEVARMTFDIFADKESLLMVLNQIETIFFEADDESLANLGYYFIEESTSAMIRNDLEPIELKKYLQPLSSQTYDKVMTFWHDLDSNGHIIKKKQTSE